MAALQWPGSEAYQHKGSIRLLTLVESRLSASGLEVWTYELNEDILIWQTPPQHSSSVEHSDTEHVLPVIFDRVSMQPNAPILTCMKQVGSQVWAGTKKGTIMAWDIASRALLQHPLLPERGEKQSGFRPISDLISYPAKQQRTMVALTDNQLTLRKLSVSLHP